MYVNIPEKKLLLKKSSALISSLYAKAQLDKTSSFFSSPQSDEAKLFGVFLKPYIICHGLGALCSILQVTCSFKAFILC